MPVPKWLEDVLESCHTSGMTGETRINWRNGEIVHWHNDVLGQPPPKEGWGRSRRPKVPMTCPQCGGQLDNDYGMLRCRSCMQTWTDHQLAAIQKTAQRADGPSAPS